MESKMKVFENKEFGFVRTVMVGNEPWFVGKDVAAALGYKNPQEAVRTHIFDEDKGVSEILTPGGTQKLTVINESGLYSLILASKIPSARAFKKWVTSEILPTIRRHGAYISDPLRQKIADNPGLLEKIVETMMYERNRANSLTEKLNEAQPKADYFDSFVNPANCTNIRDTAKELGVPERTFCKFLQNEKYLYRCPAGNLMPYSKRATTGFSWCAITTAAVISEHTPSSRRAERTCSVCCLVRWGCERRSCHMKYTYRTCCHPALGRIRTICDGKMLMLCAGDLGRMLGFKNPEEYVKKHCPHMQKYTYPGMERKMYFANAAEADVLLAETDSRSADMLEYWLCNTVIPDIFGECRDREAETGLYLIHARDYCRYVFDILKTCRCLYVLANTVSDAEASDSAKYCAEVMLEQCAETLAVYGFSLEDMECARREKIEALFEHDVISPEEGGYFPCNPYAEA